MRITKVYTRGGDHGQTSLVGGQRVDKDHLRVECYGTVDELNSIVALARVFSEQAAGDAGCAPLDTMLHRIQSDLFNASAELATPPAARWPGMRLLRDDDIQGLEQWIDLLSESLPPLEEFILPGGGSAGAFFHQARTVCRRAERRVVTLHREEPSEAVLRYLNRLSDFFFVAGRWISAHLGEPELFWDRQL